MASFGWQSLDPLDALLRGVVALRVGPCSVLPVRCSLGRLEGSLDRGRYVPQHQLEATRLPRRQAELLADTALDLVERGVDPDGVLTQSQPDHAGGVPVARSRTNAQ